MKRRSMMAVLVAAAALLSSCGSSGATEEKAKETTAATTTAAAQEAAETQAPAETAAETETEDESEAAPEIIWELREMDDSVLPDCTLTDAESEEGIPIRLACGKICEPEEEVIASLRENKWLNTLGAPTTTHREAGSTIKDETGEIGWSYQYDNGYSIVDNDREAQFLLLANFRVLYSHDTLNNDGVSRVWLEFENVNMKDSGVQQDVYKVVKEVFGDEMGEYILFAKDPDPARYAEYPNNLNITVDDGEVKYSLLRAIREDSMDITVEVSPVKENVGGYTAGYTPDFSSVKATPNQLFGTDLGSMQFNDVNFADKYRKFAKFSDDGYYDISYDINTIVSDNGKEQDKVNYRFSGTTHSYLDFDYEARYADGKFEALKSENTVGATPVTEDNYAENLAKINDTLTFMLGHKVEVKEDDLWGSGRGCLYIDATLDGKPTKIYFSIDEIDGCWRISDEFTY